MGASMSNNSDWSATGKHIFITGGSSGIGAEVARNFAKQGASLALFARSEDSLANVAKECIKLGAPKVEVFPCDITNDADLKTAIELAVDTFGKIDVLVLNAGRSQGCYFEEIKDIDSINYMFKLNVNGVINSCFYALPSVPKMSTSRIIFIGSVSGLIPVPYRTIYCASKHALTGFANSLRIELLDTYGKDSPCVQLINFPEVSGTKLNQGRMEFGADSPPVQFKTDGVATVEEAVSSLMQQIAQGSSEWGQPLKIRLLLPFRGLIPRILDAIILKTVKKTHVRPPKISS
jgi:NADP-dependent 3-hydroxy acid dehydrogenase YdfG